MKQIGVIINKNAKKVRTGRVSPDVFMEIAPEIVDTRVTSSLDEIDGVLEDFRREGISCLGIFGGDGTIHHTLSRMINLYGPSSLPSVAILKGGTMDNVSRSLNLPRTGPAILNRMASLLKMGRPVPTSELDTMKINDMYCFLFGAGLTTNFLEEVYKYEKGFISNLRVSLRAIGQAFSRDRTGTMYEPLHASVYTDGAEVNGRDFSFILSGTVEGIATGITPMSRANLRPSSFHALISRLSPGQMITRLPKLMAGREILHPRHIDRVISGLTIVPDKRFGYTMDGDMYYTDHKLEVTIGPRVRVVSF